MSLATTIAVSTLSAQTKSTPQVKRVAVVIKKTEPVNFKNPGLSSIAAIEESMLWPLHTDPLFVSKFANAFDFVAQGLKRAGGCRR